MDPIPPVSALALFKQNLEVEARDFVSGVTWSLGVSAGALMANVTDTDILERPLSSVLTLFACGFTYGAASLGVSLILPRPFRWTIPLALFASICHNLSKATPSKKNGSQ